MRMPRRAFLAATLVSLVASIPASGKGCEKKYQKLMDAMTEEQRTYSLRENYGSVDTQDVDGDGKPDKISFESRRAVTSCEQLEDISLFEKKNSIRIDYSNGKSVLQGWRGRLVDEIKLYPRILKMTAFGSNAPGESPEEWTKDLYFEHRE